KRAGPPSPAKPPVEPRAELPATVVITPPLTERGSRSGVVSALYASRRPPLTVLPVKDGRRSTPSISAFFTCPTDAPGVFAHKSATTPETSAVAIEVPESGSRLQESELGSRQRIATSSMSAPSAEPVGLCFTKRKRRW